VKRTYLLRPAAKVTGSQGQGTAGLQRISFKLQNGWKSREAGSPRSNAQAGRSHGGRAQARGLELPTQRPSHTEQGNCLSKRVVLKLCDENEPIA
jgi:hypothetical protein